MSGSPPSRILVSGSGGLVGAALLPFLATGGHDVTRLLREGTLSREDGPRWDPLAGTGDLSGLDGRLDAVVHLAGENIAAGRWTARRKTLIRDSRVTGTRFLCESLSRFERPPKILLSASAVGYYGDRGGEILREDSPPGSGFLSEVCREWEAATEPALRRGIRVVLLRFGAVLSPRGGALAKMLPAFRRGLGGRLGDGRQYMSWIALDDVVGAIGHALATPALEGPVNVVSPHPVDNREFTRTLCRVLSRPAVLPVPAVVLRAVFGEMAEELLLSSTRVEPALLTATGYVFRHPMLEEALRHLLRS